MPAFVKYQKFPLDLGLGKHDFSAHGLKIALTNRAPDVVNDGVFADIVEIAAGNGYAAGGASLTVVSWALVGGVPKLVVSLDNTLTGSGAGFGPARYAVAYNINGTKPLISYWDKGVSVTVYDTDSFLLDWDQAAGLFDIT